MKLCCDSKNTTVEAALRQIRRGGRIFIGSGCAEPSILSRGLTEFADLFADNPILHLHAQGEAAYLRPEYSDDFRHNAFVLGTNVREAVQAGRADYTPIFISDVPALFSSGSMPLDAALIQVTPPDAQGLCSLGVSVDICESRRAKRSHRHRASEFSYAAHAGRLAHSHRRD
jgi:acyl-CoA hydrolase